jgi:signal transduction histidine kinase
VGYVRAMARSRSIVRRYGTDLLLVVAALAAVAQIAGGGDDPDAPRIATALAAVLAALVVLTLLARRRAPFAAPLALWLLAAAVSFVDGRIVTFAFGIYVAGLAAAFMLGALRDELRARVGLGVVVAASTIVVVNEPGHSTGDLLVPCIFALAWFAGLAQRARAAAAESAEQRADQAEREQEAAARVAVAEERARIARELHDVVAHALSVMVLQVGTVRHRLPSELGEEAEALSGAEQTGRNALGEMRRLLGAIRHAGEEVELAPQPGLDRLDKLLEEVRGTGLDVALEVDGEPFPLPHGIDISAYRIVQEGLTNAIKHAHAHEARVRIGYAPSEVRIGVRDDGAGAAAAGDGLGHGLIGVRERVKIYGGEMQAGRVDGGGFELSTRFPIDGAAA